ncbi:MULTISPECIES: hypothetical protein [Rhodomicrobium]|uniref:hypothetical protein n=1 Tax=Rhodomicrobium TaxID=1068 RepID=UPI001483201D|nr:MULTISPECIES: hypothetical protein [Rhodomicrobium]
MPQSGLRSGFLHGRWKRVRVAAVRSSWLLAVPLAAGLASSAYVSVNAQSAGDIQVVVPALIQVQTATESPVPIKVTPRGAVPRRAMILIRGLPSTIALSHGRLFESGIWGIPVAEIGDLRIASPTGAVGRTDFSISLVTLAGDVLAEAKSSLVIGQEAPAPREVSPPPARSSTETTTAYVAPADLPPTVQPERTAPPLVKPAPTGEALDRVILYMQKGDESLKVGNLSVARLFYKRAADEGWGEGALALGATYDPVELAAMRVAGGIQADLAQARKWYELAQQMGSKLAETRLQRMSSR